MFLRKAKLETSDTSVSGVSASKPLFDTQKFHGSFVLYGNFRSGSHFFKDMVASVTQHTPTHELFPKTPRGDTKLTFRNFIDESDIRLHQYISEPRDVLNYFFSEFFESLTPTAPIIDIKYSQSYIAGINDQDGIPFLLEYFKTHSLKFVHLIRRDFIAQSISHHVARKTNQFISTEQHALTSQNEPIWLSPETVLKVAKLKKLQTIQATKLLELMDIEYTTVFYEDLRSNKAKNSIISILDFLGIYSEFDSLPEPIIKDQDSANKVINVDEIYTYAQENDFLSI